MSYTYSGIGRHVSVILFFLSLTQKCYCIASDCGDSIMALISGTIGIIFGGAALTWLANPVLFASWFYHKRQPLGALMCSIIAMLIILSFLFFKQIIANEAGSYEEIVAYKAGYWLWLSSSIVIVFSNVMYYFSPVPKVGAGV